MFGNLAADKPGTEVKIAYPRKTMSTTSSTTATSTTRCVPTQRLLPTGRGRDPPDKCVAFYCGTGWRASETWCYAYLMGWPRIAVYDGGWFEWSQDPISNPIEVGVPVEV